MSDSPLSYIQAEEVKVLKEKMELLENDLQTALAENRRLVVSDPMDKPSTFF